MEDGIAIVCACACARVCYKGRKGGGEIVLTIAYSLRNQELIQVWVGKTHVNPFHLSILYWKYT